MTGMEKHLLSAHQFAIKSRPTLTIATPSNFRYVHAAVDYIWVA